jgi:hypothetical protein
MEQGNRAIPHTSASGRASIYRHLAATPGGQALQDQ